MTKSKIFLVKATDFSGKPTALTFFNDDKMVLVTEISPSLEQTITEEIIKECGYTDDYDRGLIQKVFQKLRESVK